MDARVKSGSNDLLSKTAVKAQVDGASRFVVFGYLEVCTIKYQKSFIA